jgi:hypothetical protein
MAFKTGLTTDLLASTTVHVRWDALPVYLEMGKHINQANKGTLAEAGADIIIEYTTAV